MTVFLRPNPTKPLAMQAAARAGAVLHSEGVRLAVGPDLAKLSEAGLPVRVMPEEEALKTCDILLCIGGDGTMLHLARRAMEYQKPLLGLNVGRLGFLTAVEADEPDRLRLLAKGDFHVEHRGMLRAETSAGGARECLALNDVVLFKEQPEKTISLDIYCDDIPVSRFRGDGVIFATPTGSTAYSMSAGGPILDAKLGGIIVTQICAHIVQTPPLVFASHRVLRVVSTGEAGERVSVTCDGQSHTVVDRGDTVTISEAEHTVPLVQFSGAGQLQAIDKKLKGR